MTSISKFILRSLILALIVSQGCEDEPTTSKENDIIEPENSAPIITSLTADQDTIMVVDTLVITCTASDSDNDILKYSWSTTGGSISDTDSPIAIFLPPITGGIITITCSVTEANDGAEWIRKNIRIVVKRWITGTVTDVDGNLYKTVKIGDQWWMAENLRVTHYQNGAEIPSVPDSLEWKSLTTGAYSYLFNDVIYIDIYGNLYNWYAVNDSNNIAPDGWHVPSDEEWKQMEMHLGMSLSDANSTGFGRGQNPSITLKLKEPYVEFCIHPNSTNESGFTALPGGRRTDNLLTGAVFSPLEAGLSSYWSSTELNNGSWQRTLNCSYAGFSRSSHYKRYGYSVRCVKD